MIPVQSLRVASRKLTQTRGCLISDYKNHTQPDFIEQRHFLNNRKVNILNSQLCKSDTLPQTLRHPPQIDLVR